MQTNLRSLRLIVLMYFVTFSFLDAVSTFTGLQAGFREGNALPSVIISGVGEGGIYLLKATVVWLVVAIMLKLTDYWPKLWYALHVGTAITALAVLWNFRVLLS